MTTGLRQALQGARPRNKIINSLPSIQAPVGGLNARDALSAMRPEDALILDNFICRPTTVEARKGQSLHLNGFTAGEVVNSLHSYRAAPSDRMFAATDLGIYDATTLGTVGAKVADSTNGWWESLEGSNAGGHYLLMVNGTDPMKYFNGTTWANANITGISSSSFTNIVNFKFRVFLCEKGTLKAWYLPVNAVQGAAASFDLGPIFMRGGSLQAIATWTMDGGAGSDDLCVFLTSEGEAAVYRGNDITNPADWELVGVYSLPRPIGRKCTFKFGGDLVILTESGIVRMSSMLQSVAIDRTTTISDKIVGLLTEAAMKYKMNRGWQMAQLGAESLLLLNVPVVEGGQAVQYVMNTSTKAWSTFSGMPATGFLELGGRLFYSAKEKVVQALNGDSDFGANITIRAKLAFNQFGQGLTGKQVKLIRVNYRTSKTLSLNLAIAINYASGFLVRQAGATASDQARFDVSYWDRATWAAGDFIVAKWKSVAHKPGYALALMLQISDKGFSFSWNSTDFALESGFSL